MSLVPEVEWLGPTLPLYRYRAAAPGPTLLIQGGIHGDEVAGVHALEEMVEAGIALRAGMLLVVPVMNKAAYRAGQRCRPGGLDLNRCFPGDPAAPEPERRLASVFMQLVQQERPALMATLHESHKRYDPAVQPSFGQSIVYGVDPCPAVAAWVVERLNAELSAPNEHWSAQHYPVATSSTEVIVAATGCTGLCVETWMGFALARRVAMQRRVVELLLQHYGALG
ncbi:MAG: hypothetical protein ACPGUV_14350 [Polyangiales bacterium]